MKSDLETRARILAAAEQLFADKGFKRVTVREICRVANANVAAVNYHFGDKIGLYREVLQTAINAMRETTEAAREAGKGRKPEEQLREYIRVFLERVLKSGSDSIHRLIQREVNDPTEALDAIVEQGLRPRIEYVSGVVANMIGADPKDRRVLQCVGSVQSQVVTYLRNPVAAKLGFAFKPTPAQIEGAVDHLATFSIGGIRAIGRAAS